MTDRWVILYLEKGRWESSWHPNRALAEQEARRFATEGIHTVLLHAIATIEPGYTTRELN